MKLLLLSQNYLPFIGGVETHARQVAQALSERHAVTVAAVNFAPCRLPKRMAILHDGLLAPSFTGYQDGAVQVHALTPRSVDRLRMLPGALRVLPGTRRVLDEPLRQLGYRCWRSVFAPRLRGLARQADIIHSLAGGSLGWAMQEAAMESGVPFVCTPFVHPHQWGDDPASVRYYCRADAVVALVESDRRYLLQLGVPAEKLRVIGVSPDLQPHADAAGFRRRHGLGSAPVVLYAGRMMPQKGARALLAAAPRVWQAAPEARFVFIGPPTPESATWFDAGEKRILALGSVGAQEKTDAFAACDLFCMPSESEILPTVYLEAWSLGKPVVGGQAPGLPELVAGNDAGVAVPQDPDQIAATLIRLLRDPHERVRMGEAGRALVRRCYSVAAVTGALEALYREQVERREGALVA
jgi:glycosyltransferase involved in cell wall biosynthesis